MKYLCKVAVLAMVTTMFVAPFAQASGTLLSTDGKLRLGAFVSFGFSGEKLDIGQTTDGDTVHMNAGGGPMGGIVISYGFLPHTELGLDAAYQRSGLSQSVENASGSFSKTIVRSFLKFKLPVLPMAQLKFGGGANYYLPGDYNVDLSSAGGNEITIAYDPAFGFHGSFEVEYCPPTAGDNVFITVGVNYSVVTFPATGYTLDGMSFEADDLKPNFQDLDASCVDLISGVSIYF